MSKPPACQQCGDCCRSLIVEAGPLDALREPRIARRGHLLAGRNDDPLEPQEWAWSLSCGTACPFLRPDNTCEIYATRPDACVGFVPGESRCRHAVAQDEDEDARLAQDLVRSLADEEVQP
jgi:Fe-S-cluster containining protein